MDRRRFLTHTTAAAVLAATPGRFVVVAKAAVMPPAPSFMAGMVAAEALRILKSNLHLTRMMSPEQLAAFDDPEAGDFAEELGGS